MSYIFVVLSRSFLAIIDKEDWKKVRKHKWHAHVSKGKKKNPGQPYARATINGKKIYLHRFIMGEIPDKFHVDHKNHQTLDCRRENLEIVDHITNQRRKRNARKRRP